MKLPSILNCICILNESVMYIKKNYEKIFSRLIVKRMSFILLKDINYWT